MALRFLRERPENVQDNRIHIINEVITRQITHTVTGQEGRA